MMTTTNSKPYRTLSIHSDDTVFRVCLQTGCVSDCPVTQAIADLASHLPANLFPSPLDIAVLLVTGETLTSHDYAYAADLSAFGVIDGQA